MSKNTVNIVHTVCATCAKDPESHSFKKLKEVRGVSLFYTKPSAAKLYTDTEGILSHVDNALAANAGKKWICIIDGDGFDILHAAELSTGSGLFDLFSIKYVSTLVELKVINPTWHINGLISKVKDRSTQEFNSKITVLDDRPYSVLQFM